MKLYHYSNNRFVEDRDLSLNAFDLGCLRGYGVFDYVQLYQGKPFHLYDHLKRFQWSAEQMDLSLPMGLEEIEDITHQLIEKNPPIDAGIRLVLTGGMSGKDFLLAAGPSTLTLLIHPYKGHPSRYDTEGMRVITTQQQRMHPRVKTLHYTPAVLAMKEADKRGADDAIYLTPTNQLLEGTTSNLFFFKEGRWITAADDQVVNGVTRSILLKLAEEPIEYRAVPYEELASCEEAFLCSSVKDAVPVAQIDDIVIGGGVPGPNTLRMRSRFRNYLETYLSNSQVHHAC